MAIPAPITAPAPNAIADLIVTSTAFRVSSSGIERWLRAGRLYSLCLFVCSIRQSLDAVRLTTVQMDSAIFPSRDSFLFSLAAIYGPRYQNLR